MRVRRGGANRDEDKDTYNVADSIVCWQQRSFRVRHFLLELEDCRVDLVKVQTGNNDETPLYKFIN